MRQCPRYDDMQQWAAKFNHTIPVQDAKLMTTGSSKFLYPMQPRPPNPENSSSFFGEDASMTIFDLACPSEKVENPALPSLESTPKNPRTMLFVVR